MKKLNVIIQLPIFTFYRKQEVDYTFDGSRLYASESLEEMDYNVYTVLCEMEWPDSITPSEIAKMLGIPSKGGHLTNIKKALLHLGQVSYTFENCLVEGQRITTPLLHVTKVGRKYLIELPEPFRQQYQAWKWQTIDFQKWLSLPNGIIRKLYEFLERRKNQYKSQDFKIRYSLLEKWIGIKDQRTFNKSMKSLERLWDVESDILYTFKAKGINQNDETKQVNEPIETKAIAAKEETQNDETQMALVVKTITNNLTIKENDNEECNQENSNLNGNYTQAGEQKKIEQTRKGTNGETNKVENPSPNKKMSYTGDYKAVGREGEAVIVPFLSWFFPNAKIEDVRENREFQFCDVDFVAQMADGRKLLLEIKSDKYLGKTGNFLVEVFRRYSSGDGFLGWLYRSRADYMFFYACNIEKIYVSKLVRLKEYCATKRGLSIKEVMTDSNTITYIFLIPEKELIEKKIIQIYDRK